MKLAFIGAGTLASSRHVLIDRCRLPRWSGWLRSIRRRAKVIAKIAARLPSPQAKSYRILPSRGRA
jgi:hypothetical protein